MGSNKNAATTLSRMIFSGYLGHATVFSWMLTIACTLVVGFGLRLDLVSGYAHVFVLLSGFIVILPTGPMHCVQGIALFLIPLINCRQFSFNKWNPVNSRSFTVKNFLNVHSINVYILYKQHPRKGPPSFLTEGRMMSMTKSGLAFLYCVFIFSCLGLLSCIELCNFLCRFGFVC